MPAARDLVVIIPTRARGDILRRTLDALRRQSVSGFEIVVVIDGADQDPPAFEGIRVVVQDHGGPGKARNTGVAASDAPLLLFLGDDIVPTPDLVRQHLALHERHPDPADAAMGHIDWHPETGVNRMLRWMDWSGAQFDFRSISGSDAGWGRFYSSNVSLKRSLFEAAGGFDEAFVYYYEDLDLAWRLHERGLRLHYVRDARGEHLHRYDWPTLRRRFAGIARGERMMKAKYDWFEPYFAQRIAGAVARPPESSVWPVLADRIPYRPAKLRRRVRPHANRWYLQRLANDFVNAWEGERDVEELRAYLGDEFDYQRLVEYQRGVEEEARAVGDERRFYRTARSYLYDLTAFAMTGTKLPYHAVLRELVGSGATLLDYGCGIGSDGLRLLDYGYRVTFADFANPSTEYLRWRLARRGHDAEIFDIDSTTVPGGFALAYAFDVIEHAEDPFAFLEELEARAGIVLVNFLDEDEDDVDIHHELPIADLLAHARRRGIVHESVHFGRSYLVAYRGDGPVARAPGTAPARPTIDRLLGRRAPAPASYSAVAGWQPRG